jgi:hypothetical protein
LGFTQLIRQYYYFSGSEFCPSPIARIICEEYPELLALGIKGIVPETHPDHWPFMRLASYVAARCQWDTTLTYEEVLTDYCNKMYGPASPPMKAYHLLYDNTIRKNVPVLTMYTVANQVFPPAFSPATISTLHALLQEAADMAAADGKQSNINAVKAETQTFAVFKSVAADPADIPGIGANLVTNPGAEDDSQGWIGQVLRGKFACTTPSGTGRNSDKAFKLECTDKNSKGKARWVQMEVPVTLGKKYAGRIWFRATDGARGRIVIYQEVGEGKGVYISWRDSGDKWQPITIPQVTAVTNKITIFLESYGRETGGTVYFDDIFLAQLP